MELVAYCNEASVAGSNELFAGKQMIYFSAEGSNNYNVNIIKPANITSTVKCAYAWSYNVPNEIDKISIKGKFAVGQTITAEAEFSDGTVIPDTYLNYSWSSSEDGLIWTEISNATSSNYTISSNDLLKYLRCTITPNVSMNWIQGTYTKNTDEVVIKYGDVNFNDIIEVRDCSLVQLYLDGGTELDNVQIRAADVNGDGLVTVDDMNLIQLFISEFITTFPVELEE